MTGWHVTAVLLLVAASAAAAAAQIQHARRAVLPEDTRHRLQPQVVQPDRELDGVFAGILPRDGAGIGVAVPLALREPRDRLARQPALMTQVPLRDEPSLRMVGQPAFAAPQQFLQLILTDVVVLVVVEHRDQDVQVREQRGQRLLS